MKRFFALAAPLALTLLFAGCDTGTSAGVENKLTLVNESFTPLTGLTWGGVSFGMLETGGKGVTRTVSPGTGYLRFSSGFNALSVRTSELIAIEEGDNKKITLTDNTLIVDVDNPDSPGALGVLGRILKTPARPALTAGNKKIQVNWQRVAGAEEYAVYCGAETAPPEEPALTITGTSAAITGLEYETPYYVWVQAVKGGTKSALSPAAAITLPVPSNTLTWSGYRTKQSETKYASPVIAAGEVAAQELSIVSNLGCSVQVKLSASCNPSNSGLASKLYESPLEWDSIDGLEWLLGVNATVSGTWTYAVPAGAHTIAFAYVKNSAAAPVYNDKITVEVLAVID
jgi:hypothetical protein